MDHPCPHCAAPIRGRDLATQPSLRRYRTCPSCRARITLDRPTKQRQLVALAVALAALAFTVLASTVDSRWFAPAALSYLVLATVIAYGERRLRFVPYER